MPPLSARRAQGLLGELNQVGQCEGFEAITLPAWGAVSPHASEDALFFDLPTVEGWLNEQMPPQDLMEAGEAHYQGIAWEVEQKADEYGPEIVGHLWLVQFYLI